MAQVTVIVVNWNGKASLIQCLDALREQSAREMAVIVVDNGSVDGSVAAVKALFPEVTLIALKENLGFAAANNIAIRSVRTEYVALLNNDAIAHPLWLETLIEAMRRYPEAGFAASKMLYQDMPHIIDRAGDGYTTAGAGSLRGRGRSADTFFQTEWIFGACAGAALYRMAMLDDIGLFDEDFFLLYEDVDLSFRAQLKGYKCRYVPDAVVYHQASRTIGYDSPTSVYYGHRNLEWVYFQNMPASLLTRTAMRHLMYTIAAFGFFAAKGLSVAFIRAKWDGFKAWKTVLNKRKKNQARRRVKDDYIWSLLEAEHSFSRLSHRLKRHSLKKAACD
ncbi:MAG: glycosyltransferase family 2 protein [Deltaproteobacteria bacterium]|nr:glycosyltransferase family 2 protein [Deltaproteobacteria bacterium]